MRRSLRFQWSLSKNAITCYHLLMDFDWLSYPEGRGGEGRGGEGRGELPYMGYIGISGTKGYGFF